MADHTPFSPTKIPSTPISSFLGSPRFLNGVLSEKLPDAEITTLTPTSILDTKHSSFVNPFAYDTNLPKLPNPSPEINKLEPQAIGLALIDSIDEEKNDGHSSKPVNRMNLFGSKLKIQIPTVDLVSPVESPNSPADFGIKTRNSQILSPFVSTPSKEFNRQLSLKEMELSEDYTCVIIHGPNPKTTHIFDDCIVESCSEDDDDAKFDEHMKMDFEPNVQKPALNFLSFCHNCKDRLEQGKDIYIYREKRSIFHREWLNFKISVFPGVRKHFAAKNAAAKKCFSKLRILSRMMGSRTPIR